MIFASPMCANLDIAYTGEEVIISSNNGKIYAWHNDGTGLSDMAHSCSG